MCKYFIIPITVAVVFFSCSNSGNKKNNATIDTVETVKDTVYQKDSTVQKNLNSSVDYWQKPKNAQQFTINANKKETIIGKKGTKITFNPNSLVYIQDEAPVEGDINIVLKEYFSASDILLAELTTTSNGNLFGTSGIIHIEAIANGKELKLKKGATIDVSFPNKITNPNITLYNGERDKKDSDWILKSIMPKSSGKKEIINDELIEEETIDYQNCYELYRKNFVKPQFKNDDTTALCSLLVNEINPYLLTVPTGTQRDLLGREIKLQEFLPYLHFWVKEESIKQQRELIGRTGLTGILPTRALDKITKQSHDLFIKPGTLNGQNVTVEVSLPATLTPDSQHIQFLCPTDEDFRVSPEDSKSWHLSCWRKVYDSQYFKKKIDAEGVQKLNVYCLDTYTFSSTSLRWLILNVQTIESLTSYRFDVGENDDFYGKIILKRKNNNVVLQEVMKNHLGIYYYNTLPNEPIIMLIFKTVNGIRYVAVKETLPEDFPTLEFKELTPKLLEEIIKMIDRKVGGKY